MTRHLIRAAALACLMAAPAAALDLDAMTSDERAAFRAEVRAYLLDNPEVLMEAIGVLEAREAEAQANVDSQMVELNAAALFDDPDAWVGGNPEGDITLVEFLDYRCGYCRRAHPEVAELIESDGNIRLIVKEFPILGEQSVLASRFALAVKEVAGNDAYGAVSDALMTMRSDVTEESLTRLAEQFDLDTDAVMAAMDTEDVNRILQDNRALAQRMQITGTPTFVLEDQMLRGYLPLEQMRALVEEARSEG